MKEGEGRRQEYSGWKISEGIRTEYDFDRGKVGTLEREALRMEHNRKLSMSPTRSSRSLPLYSLFLPLRISGSPFPVGATGKCMHRARNIESDEDLSTTLAGQFDVPSCLFLRTT